MGNIQKLTIWCVCLTVLLLINSWNDYRLYVKDHRNTVHSLNQHIIAGKHVNELFREVNKLLLINTEILKRENEKTGLPMPPTATCQKDYYPPLIPPFSIHYRNTHHDVSI